MVLSGPADSTAFQMSVRSRISSVHSDSTYFHVFNLSGKKPFYISRFQGRETRGERETKGDQGRDKEQWRDTRGKDRKMEGEYGIKFYR